MNARAGNNSFARDGERLRPRTRICIVKRSGLCTHDQDIVFVARVGEGLRPGGVRKSFFLKGMARVYIRGLPGNNMMAGLRKLGDIGA
eukprot:4316030-Pyramimonas_sp.AAC.1